MTDTPDAVLTSLRDRERSLQHEFDMIAARLSEVRDLIELIEKPARRPRTPRTVRLDDVVPPPDDAA